MSRKAALTSLAGLLALIFLIVSAGWLWAQTVVVQGWETWIEERRAEGYSFRNVEPEVRGFPLRVIAHLESPEIAAPRGWRWQAPAIRAEAGLWDPFLIDFQAPGVHRLRLPDGRELTALAEEADGRLEMDQAGELHEAALVLRRVTLEGLPGVPLSAEALDVSVGPADTAHPDELGVAFSAALRGLLLPERLDLPFERRVTTVGVTGVLHGRLPARATPADLQAWRARGGHVAVDSLRLDWQPLRLDGSGELGLDGELRPEGELDMDVRGLDRALDRLAEAGVLDSRTVTYAKLAVAALGERDPDTGVQRVNVPVTLRDGRFYLGPVALFELSPVLADRTAPPDALR